MNSKELLVTVKNKLGKKYGNRHVAIKENEDSTASQSVEPDGAADFPTGKEHVPLRSIEIETGRITRQAAIPTVPSIPITIESPVDCTVDIKQGTGQNKWRLEFKTAQIAQTARDVVSKDGDPDKVNVTVGGDEPPAPPPAPSPMIYAAAGGFGAGWLISSCAAGAAPLIGYGIPILTLAVGIIGGFVYWLKRKQ